MRQVATTARLRSAARRVVDAILRPARLAIGPKALVERARRTSYGSALDQAKRAGFEPMTVIDVGVARGTPPLYEAFPHARLVLVEPLEEARPHLEAIATRYPNVACVVAAAGARAGRITLNVHRDMERTSQYWESDFRETEITRREVPVVPLDQLRRELALVPPFLLKLDVQGAELDVLAGAQETLIDTEYLIVEVSLFQSFDEGPLFADVVSYLHRHQFVLYDVLSIQYRPLDGAVSTMDLAFVRAPGPFRLNHRFQSHPLV